MTPHPDYVIDRTHRDPSRHHLGIALSLIAAAVVVAWALLS